MIRITELKCLPSDTLEDVRRAAANYLRCQISEIDDFVILRQSVDARKKPDILLVYEVSLSLKCARGLSQEDKYIKKRHLKCASVYEPGEYVFPYKSTGEGDRPLIVGMGPAGLFCALELARAGFKPLLIERGKCVEERTRDVEAFWNGGSLNPESNVSFGEGGAGTFSDGKLNTLVKTSKDIHRYVLKTFTQFGAQQEIMYSYKPHIGTDVLRNVVKNIREEIISLGGEVMFNTKLTGIRCENDAVTGALLTTPDGEMEFLTGYICLACGHSARDTFNMLYELGVNMEQKPFAVGVRMEHPQSMINQSQYGRDDLSLGAAPYKLTTKADNGRGVYSFCMCPGGYVVNASSVPGMLAVNGMSYSDRGSSNANSAIIVTVSGEDFGSDDVFAGVRFQEKLEKAAYEAGQGRIPVQCYGDFVSDRVTEALGDVKPMIKGNYTFANLRRVLPEELSAALISAIPQFGRKIHGFDREDAILSGVESRTSSPIRIVRDEDGASNIRGLYPCGEGAGYAGGITSAAIDGIKVAQFIAKDILSI
ncbi:MAG: FAD-dependent oxidoreductase [Lachnospiraceae bacterium]|nr:FAD-dependent oxidoreductase [Lachnospiraceae bacterium]